MHRRIAVRGIFIHDGKLLAIKHKPYAEQRVDHWCVIGGGVDVGEPLIPALCREIIEETGIIPKIGRLLYIQQFADQTTEHTEFFFLIENAADYIDVDLSQTTHGKDEIEYIEYVDPSDPKYALLPKFLTEIDLEHLPQNTEFFNYLSD